MKKNKDKKQGGSTVREWAKMWPYVKPYRRNVITLIGVMITSAVVDLVYTLMSGYAVDNFITPRSHEGIWPFAAAYLLMLCVLVCSTMTMGRMSTYTEVRMNRDMRKNLFTHLQTLSFSYYNQTPVGTILSRVMSDTSRITETFAWNIVDLFYSGCYLVGCMVVMLAVNWKLALLVIIIVPILALLVTYFQKRILAVNREARRINAEITRHYNEGISGAKTSKTLVIEDKNTEAFKAVTGKMKSTSIRAERLNAIYVPLISLATALAVSMVITGGGTMVLGDYITIGELTVFVNYALIIADHVQGVAGAFSSFISAQANIERVTALLELEPDITDTPEVIEKYGTSLEPKRENWEHIEGHIKFDDITFRYPDGTENVLEHFSLDVPAGKTVAIVGETGAGKSTLVNLACRFFEPTEGQILIDGRDYRERSMLWLHSSIGYVLQTPHLFSGTVKENIRYGRLNATDEEIIAAAKLVNAHDFIMRMEKGYDSDVGEGGGQLSTGEKQLISFARAVLANPKIFVLDEATASIDTKTEALIQEAISTLLEGRTSFLIAHRLSTIRKADMILVVRGGKIIERGTHGELMALGGYYADLYNKQFEAETTAAVLNA